MKILLFANADWYMYNFNRSLADALRKRGHEVVLLSPPGPYGDKLVELGFRWIPAPMDRRSLMPGRELAFLLWLRQFFITEHFDLVHNFTIKCAVYGSLAARFSGIETRVNTVSGLGYVFTSNDLKARMLRPIVRFLMRSAFGGIRACLILLNNDDVTFFKRAGLVNPASIRLIFGAGVNCQRFSPLDKGREIKRLQVLLAARLLWDKGLTEYIEASRQLRLQGRNIDFLLAGSPDLGNPAAVPDSILRQWVADGLVRWLGHVDDMPTLLQSVDVMVLPSYREGLPTGLTEAAACGLALVATDVPGCREVITDGVDGLLVPVRNADALAVAITRLSDDPQLRARLGANARQKALKEFDEKIVIERTLAVYSEFFY